MTGFLLFAGILFVIMGLLFWKRNVAWFHQSAMYRPKKEGYRKFMGLADICAGLCMLLAAAVSVLVGFEAPNWIVYIICLVYLVFVFYGEKKYRLSKEEEDKTNMDRG